MKRWRYKVTIRVESMKIGGGDIPGFIDMLRYDGARVLSWDHDADGKLTVHLEAERHPEVDRWASFMLRPRDIEQRNY